jgi:drug/metabolite transporter (DMT)-like permease
MGPAMRSSVRTLHHIHAIPPSPSNTAQAYLRVPIGVALGVVFLCESLSPTAWVGLACVVTGVAAMTIPARKVAAVPKAA